MNTLRVLFPKASSPFRRAYHTWAYETDITKATPQFIVTPKNGFLPRTDPLEKLPPKFKELESLLERMPLQLKSGEPGLLARGEFGKAVKAELPLYDVAKITDSALLMALFRAFTFMTSGWLLEPTDLLRRQKQGEFGEGRDHLPKEIALPLTQIAEKIGAKPFMEYAQSYALYNYARIDKRKPVEYDNLRLITSFSGLPSESGFILVHVDMVAHTKRLVRHVITALDAISKDDRFTFEQSLAKLVDTMQSINACMEKMWKRSSPADYMKFRTFILGTKNQMKIFPKGVVYEGVSEEPQFFRGESGANDSIIPTVDNFLQLTEKMPNNEMTDILKDFRGYRPADHARWLQWVDSSAKELNVEKYCERSPRSLVSYMMLLDEVRDFRLRHWRFAKEYIIKRTPYPTATGGSPMATWLPNQLMTVLRTLQQKYLLYDKMQKGHLYTPINGHPIDDHFYKGIMTQMLSLSNDIDTLTSMYGRYNR